MPFPSLLTRQLTALTKGLNDPGPDLEAALSTLTGQLGVAVPGFLGLTITVQSSGIPVTLTAIDPGVLGSARGCLLLALPPAPGTRAGGSVVFYAATPGAFRALIEGTDPGNDSLDGVYVLDHHLPLVTDLPHPVGISGLDEVTALNRAIGVLLARGCTLGQARTEMRRRAAAA